MREVILKNLHTENFKGPKDFNIDFSTRTRIKGMNGVGKSTVVGAYMWLFFGVSYSLESNPKVRREVDGVPVEGEVSVTAELLIDGKEVTAKKIQKRKLSKKEGDNSYSDDNTYIINDMPRTLKDFNAYFGFDMTVFLLCSNINKFLSQKSEVMREFLFALVKSVTDMDIARKYPELALLAVLLESKTKDEIKAGNNASLTELNKENDEIAPRIDQLQKSIVDADFAEQELALSALKEQLSEFESKLADTSKAYEEVTKIKAEIAECKVKISDIETDAKTAMAKKRQELTSKIDGIAYNLLRKTQQLSTVKSEADLLQSDISAKETFFEVLGKEYTQVKSSEIDPNKNICPSCKREYEEDKKAEIQEAFIIERKTKMDELQEKGKLVRGQINSGKERLTELETQITTLTAELESLTTEDTAVKAEISTIPAEIDLSGNKDYQDLKASLSALEFALKETQESLSDTNTLRDNLNASRTEIQRQIDEVNRLLGAKDANTRAEDTIVELQEKRRVLNQKIADCDKVKDMLDTLSRKKNELLVDEINSRFSLVKWKLFELNKSGTYQDVCVPTVDGKSLNDDTANKGLKIAGRIDICQSIQKIAGIRCPIWLDDAESINEHNIPDVGCQLITLKVVDPVYEYCVDESGKTIIAPEDGKPYIAKVIYDGRLIVEGE